MNAALDYARKNIVFWASSPISGVFNEAKYPFVVKPLLSIDDIRTREVVIYGPTQAIKTVLLQIVVAYVLDMRRKSLLAVAQTDDDSRSFSQVKLTPFLERIPSLMETLKKGRSGATISQMLWASHELIISGPGENAQESKSVAVLVTDEAHRWNIAYPGAMAALRNRMGLRWDRLEFHATTAAEVGTEIDIEYHAGQQDEWHVRCLGCNKLIWLLWTESSRKHYNGHEVFQWKESQSETEMLDSICLVCPHCGLDHEDNPHNRADMDLGADYVTMNPVADIAIRSYRWNAFAPRWKAWRDLLAIYKKAIHSAKLGNLEPYRDWVTKQLVESWENQYPMLGDSTLGRDYAAKDVIPDPTKLRVASIDVQEGKGGDVFHLWLEISEWERSGDSRRILYERCATWEDARALQIKFGVPDKTVGVDCGDRPREVFAVCARFHWLALKSGDEEGFSHPVTNPTTHVVSHVALPYSTTRLESATVGKETQKNIRLPRGGKAPSGFAISRLWSKPVIYGILYALKQGTAGRKFGIATDINPIYIEQLHAYVPGLEVDKKTRSVTKTIWRKVKDADHSFICSSQGLLMALINGYYPMAKDEERKAA